MSSARAGDLPRAPKYYLVKQHLLERIESLPPGSPVPTERDLTAELETSRTTVRPPNAFVRPSVRRVAITSWGAAACLWGRRLDRSDFRPDCARR